jgi:hypothetical protein
MAHDPHESQANIRVTAAGGVVAAIGGTQVPGIEVPAAATNHPAGATRGASRVS